ncbi:hypothetical protein F4805DRAFT_476636 [Annulohypoxylon moriforme]|nr:hypothetical protein F4805DRAFT_476636 [Annulohypoxylon moriforme]
MSYSLEDRFAALVFEEDEEEIVKPKPLRFYRDDGKLFWRSFDITTAHLVDEDWNNEVVYYDENTSVEGRPHKEVNYNRWKLFEGTDDYQEYRRLLDNTWVIESSLNSLDFDPVDRTDVELPPLDNRIDVPLEKLYPKGAQMLIRESRRTGPEWKEGQPLGPNPTREDLLKKPVGWAPPQQRQWRRGLGGDITDPVQKHWFHGDLDVPLPEGFVEPKEPWSRHPARLVFMKSAVTKDNPESHEFMVQSYAGVLWWRWAIKRDEWIRSIPEEEMWNM